MRPGRFDFDDTVVNDGIDPTTFIYQEDKIPVDITGYDVRMTFVHGKSGDRVIFVPGSGLTILNAAGGEVRLEEFALDLVGDWFHDLQFTAPGGLPRTYLVGKIEILSERTE